MSAYPPPPTGPGAQRPPVVGPGGVPPAGMPMGQPRPGPYPPQPGQPYPPRPGQPYPLRPGQPYGYSLGYLSPEHYRRILASKRRVPTSQTTLGSLTWLMLSAGLLVASLVLPLVRARGSDWLTGQTLASFGPQLLGGEVVSGGNVFFFIMMALTLVCGLGMLLGSARLLNRGWSIALGILAGFGLAQGLLTSLILLISAISAVPGVAVVGLPLGFLGCLLSCFIPSIRDGWIRPPKSKEEPASAPAQPTGATPPR